MILTHLLVKFFMFVILLTRTQSFAGKKYKEPYVLSLPINTYKGLRLKLAYPGETLDLTRKYFLLIGVYYACRKFLHSTLGFHLFLHRLSAETGWENSTF